MKFNYLTKKVVAVLATIFIFNSSFITATESEESSDKNLTITCMKHNYNLNPHTSAYVSESQILVGLYEGLFSYDPITLDPLYAIAKNYRLSRDKKRWTFELRDDAKFSNGNPITAHDVKESWLRLISNPQAVFSSLFDIIKGSKEYRLNKATEDEVGIYIVDDYTITVHLKSPASHLPKILCMPAFSVIDFTNGAFSGPYLLKTIDQNTIVLEKNPFYYDYDKIDLKTITFILCNDGKENTYLYNTGKADWLSDDYEAKSIIKSEDIRISAQFGTQYFFFKLNENSPLNCVTLRQALLEAAPWKTLRERTYVPATTFVYPLAGYPAVEGYVFTDTQNGILLAKDARKEMSLNEDEIITINFAIPDYEFYKKLAQALKEAWSPLGINLEITPVPSSLYLDSIEITNYDLYTYTWIGDFADPLAFLELFRSNSNLNVSKWSSSEYDNLLDQAALFTDENHAKLLAKAEQLLLDSAMVLPIQHPVSANVINLEAIGGWSINSFDIHPLKWLFKRETQDSIPNVVLK